MRTTHVSMKEKIERARSDMIQKLIESGAQFVRVEGKLFLDVTDSEMLPHLLEEYRTVKENRCKK